MVVLAFRKLIEMPLSELLPGGPDNFEGLHWSMYFLFPFTGGIVLAILFSIIDTNSRRVGVVHVLERLARHQGHLPARNLITQLLAGTIALVSGQSGGREGPAIHLGAAGSSLLGQYLSLPNNSIRVLVGCGAAAAISASFDTPIAGVIFSMEVIIMEYTIAGFIPVILAAVTAALIVRLFYGSDPAFNVPQVSMESFNDLPVVILEGVLIGALAAALVYSIRYMISRAPPQIWLRMMIAGTVTGLIALMVPQVLGIGYDTVNAAIVGELSFTILIAVCVFKLLATATSVAMGMPIGLIGPTLIIGATAGGIIWLGASSVLPDLSSPAFYVMLGMGAMMGAVLQAPLAALMAIMELTHNPNIVVPAMLVIIIANITASEVFKLKSIFITQMELLGLEYRQNPLSMALNRASVASIMERSFERVSTPLSAADAQDILDRNPNWLLVDLNKSPSFILRTEDLDIYISKLSSVKPEDLDAIDLMEIPATRKDVTNILLQATLGEALNSLKTSGVQALYVNRITAPMMDSPVGIITLEDLESYYQP
jgi:CIC family chloride channel protein